MGLDIIETDDGGYALTGTIYPAGTAADAVVIKLDATANTVWSKRFDHSSDGDDAVGIIQKGDTLVVAIDLQNSTGNYSIALTKIKLSDGTVLTTQRLTPLLRGLFNPYLYKNPAAPGYIISGHTIDGTSYNNMRHTIIRVNENLDITDTKLISMTAATDDFFTGFVPLSDGSFIGAASPQANADGYIYKVNANNAIAWARRFNVATDRRVYRLASLGNDIIAVGGTVSNSQEDGFVAQFYKDGSLGAACNVDDITIAVQQPVYNTSAFSWTSVNAVTYANPVATLTTVTPSLIKQGLCSRPTVDFSYQQNLCNPKTLQFSSSLTGVQTYQWNFGNGQTATGSGPRQYIRRLWHLSCETGGYVQWWLHG
jgi:hypothetical protein